MVYNPFKFGKEVSGDQFYDRTEVANDLYRMLASGSANVVIAAPRRYGKSSLVMKVLERFRAEGVACFCIDLSRAKSLENFCEDYASAVYSVGGKVREVVHTVGDFLSRLHPTISFGTGSLPVTVKFDYEARITDSALAEVLDLPERLSHQMGDVPIVIAFDEFQEVGSLSHDLALEKIFRSCIQAHRNVRYVFLGSKTHLMARMFSREASPFYKSALSIKLGKPPAEESRAFVRARFQSAGRQVSDAVLDRILAESQNIPYYLQAVAALTFDAMLVGDRNEPTMGDIDKACERIVDGGSDAWEQQVREMSDAQRRLASALAESPTGEFGEAYRLRFRLGAYSTVRSALQTLQDDGVVSESERVYALADPFFVRYLKTSSVSL